ncbi:hypothetical protein HKW97_24355 (plasmid) [Pseudomonas luteola]|uniref:hypothetical protein n=1 Tax=Pseudomonas luteola TaxID=47886 RepID=UPI003890C96D
MQDDFTTCAMLLGEREISTLNNCLLDFKTLKTSMSDNYILLLVESLAKGEGLALEYSGVYIDSDLDGTPEEFIGNCGVTFEFMGEAVNVSKGLAAILMQEWCRKNIITENKIIHQALKNLRNTYPV